jgi:signal transduction histidine kinase
MRRVLVALNPASLGVAVGFAITAAVLFAPIFVVSLPVLLGRTLFLAMVLLLTFVGAQQLPERWLPHWLPRWLFTLLAVALAAPLATFAVYLVSVGGDVEAFLKSPPRITGFILIAGAALTLGMIITLTALLREREARARTLALQFELERSRLERQALDARLALLTAQIEPHFLFNTLANVQALVESGSPRAAPVLASLIAYLRASVPRLHAGEPLLGNEIALVQAYLELMRMRMPDRLSFELRTDPALAGARFPPMTLLTLAENAVRHGIDPAEDGGRIEVGCRRDESGALRVWVADTGRGMSEHAAPGTGLANLRERLQGFFGSKAELRLSENSPCGLRAEVVVRP